MGGPVKGAGVVGGLTTGQLNTWQHRSMGSGTLWHVAGMSGTRAHLLFTYFGTYCTVLTTHRKVESSNPGRSGGRIFFSRVHFAC